MKLEQLLPPRIVKIYKLVNYLYDMNLANEAGYLYVHSKELLSINKQLKTLSKKSEKHAKKHAKAFTEGKKRKHREKYLKSKLKMEKLMKRHKELIKKLEHHRIAFHHALAKHHKI